MNNEILAHYTSLDALFGIIKKDGLHFRATRYNQLNDTHEYKWAYEPLLKKIAEERLETKEEINNLYEKFPYVISFSQKEDNHLLWHLYGGCGKGVSLVLDSNVVSQACDDRVDWDVFQKVRYATKENVMKKLECAVADFRNSSCWVADESEEFDDKIYACAFVKNEEWEYENEWRYARVRENNISVHPTADSIKYTPIEDKHELRFYARGSQVIPYLDVYFEPKALSKIILGNGIDYNQFSSVIKNLLVEFGDSYNHVRIEASKAIF